MQSRAWLEGDVLGHAGFAPPRRVIGPLFRQIQPIIHRQAGVVVGNRQRYRHLTIVPLAQLAAILPRHADRVLPLLGKARVVDNPRHDRAVALDLRHNQLAHFGQYFLIRPSRDTDEMQQRLVLRRRPPRRRLRRHRLNALALARQHQPRAIIAQRSAPIGVTNHPRQFLNVSTKPQSTRPHRFEIHADPQPNA